MATSGSINFSRTRDQLIDTALKLLGVLGEGETASTNAVTDLSVLLNSMIKAWEGQGVNLWREDEATVFLTSGTNTYTLVNSGTGDKASAVSVETELSTSAAASATSIAVTSITGMAASDIIGIELDDNTIHWTTISGSPSALTITLTAGLASVASSGNNVYVYTTKLNRPLDITYARLRYDDGHDRELRKLGRREYFQIVNKNQSGKPVAFYYSPQLSTGKLYLWPTPDAVKDRLKVSYIRSIEDFDGATDDPDFPAEWLEAIAYNLAVRAAPAYGIDINKDAPEIMAIAMQSFMTLQLWDSESTSTFICPGEY